MAALYQRARPTTFAQVVGQEHVKDVLAAAVQSGRVSHAYLFSGPRGVGKTTMARLLAMAVNCEAGPDKAPCGKCDSCTMVQAGSHPDVMELDAASNNSVDDVRDLQERIGLASMLGGKRVWILDEAHMLSKPAANALLKTLEEPPPGLVFILATTEPERLPTTILSRCQHFRFRRFTDEQIVSKLAAILEGENAKAKADKRDPVEVEPAALNLVARSADGGMRDAETLLERLLVPGQPVTLAKAEDALGLPPREQLATLAAALASGNLQGLMQEAASLYNGGFAPRTVAEQLARYLREALHARLTGTPVLELGEKELLLALHALDDEQERFVRVNDLYSLEVALIKTSNALTGNLPVATPTHLSDAAPAASATARAPAAGSSASAPTRKSPTTPAGDPLPPFEPNRYPTGAGSDVGSGAGEAGRTDTTAASSATTRPATTGDGTTSGSTAHEDTSAPRRSFSWHNVRAKAGPQLKAFLMPAAASLEGNEVTLVYQDTHSFHHSQLLLRRKELEALLEAELGPGLRLVVEGPGGQRSAPPRASSPAATKAQPAQGTDASKPHNRHRAASATATTAVSPSDSAPPPSYEEASKAAETSEGAESDEPESASAKAPATGGRSAASSSPASGSSEGSLIPDDVSFGMEELPPDFWDTPTVAAPDGAGHSQDHHRGSVTAVSSANSADMTPARKNYQRNVSTASASTPGAPAGGLDESEHQSVDDETGPHPLEQAFQQIQSLFPGYVVEVKPGAGQQIASEAASPAGDDFGEDDGYDEDDQDRLLFGPAN